MPDQLEELQRIAEFDHVFTVTPAGAVVDGPRGIYAPEYYDDTTAAELTGAGWEALTGYTGQYGYSGPHMHASEFIGGRLARDILETPGAYVVVVVAVMPDTEDDDPEPAGWAVLRQTRQCVYVVDGTDTDGTVWHQCVTHDETTPSADAQCAMAAAGAGSAGLVTQ